MADKPLRWTGKAVSATRRDSQGQPQEYTLKIFKNGQAECTCPHYIIHGKNNRAIPESEKMWFRCKHLNEAFLKLGDGMVQLEPIKECAMCKRQGSPCRRHMPSGQSSKPSPLDTDPNGLGLDEDEFRPFARRT